MGASEVAASRGVGASVLSFVMAFVIGGASSLARVLFGALLIGGASIATLAMPELPRFPRIFRAVSAVAVALVLIVLDPLSLAYRHQAQTRLHGDDAERELALRDLLTHGRDLHGEKLAGLALAGFDLRAVDLTGADLSGADLTGANLWGSKLDGAALAGAHLAKADLSDSTLAAAHGVDTALCDQATQLPLGWKCASGQFVSVPLP
jgi:hypothetical protein